MLSRHIFSVNGQRRNLLGGHSERIFCQGEKKGELQEQTVIKRLICGLKFL